MLIRKTIAAASLLVLLSGPALAENFLIHIHTGPDNPTKAALGFLVAATAVKDGHHVDLFLAGDGASLITDDALSSVEGLGTGKLQDHFTALVEGGAKIFISGMSAKAREITDVQLEGKPAEFAMPSKLVELAAAADVVLVY
ncbi:MAG TPA: DsrE family protein [Devosia sp.]